jgi:hypothetical protein
MGRHFGIMRRYRDALFEMMCIGAMGAEMMLEGTGGIRRRSSKISASPWNGPVITWKKSSISFCL